MDLSIPEKNTPANVSYLIERLDGAAGKLNRAQEFLSKVRPERAEQYLAGMPMDPPVLLLDLEKLEWATENLRLLFERMLAEQNLADAEERVESARKYAESLVRRR